MNGLLAVLLLPFWLAVGYYGAAAWDWFFYKRKADRPVVLTLKLHEGPDYPTIECKCKIRCYGEDIEDALDCFRSHLFVCAVWQGKNWKAEKK